MNVTGPLFLLDFGPVAFPILHDPQGLANIAVTTFRTITTCSSFQFDTRLRPLDIPFDS
jgi:hypothetical protein